MRKPKHYEVIVWEDPSSDFSGWKKVKDLKSEDPQLAVSIGWLVFEDENVVRLAMDYSDGECNTRGDIPKFAIKYRRRTGFRLPKNFMGVTDVHVQKEEV